MSHYRVLGIMSGTSLDGLDLAYCQFHWVNHTWSFSIDQAETLAYPDKWRQKLQIKKDRSQEALVELHNHYGSYIGEQARWFLDKHNLKVDFIASHGHTLFHEPGKKISFQLGNGPFIAASSGITTLWDFRSLDIALGGQGAPLVPIGDELLFADYKYCLNLGGFSNISFNDNNRRIAFDICPVNIILNALAREAGYPYDKDGWLASRGQSHQKLLDELNNLSFYQQKGPKSLGIEWVNRYMVPVLNKYDISAADKLNTLTDHISFQIQKIINQYGKGKILLTGGGAYNTFLIDKLRDYLGDELIIPEPLLIDYKEALIFAFLGTLRKRNQINCLSSVTGARQDSSCGNICRV